MRINFVLPDGMGLGGVTTWSLAMANALAARGGEVTLLEHVNPSVPLSWSESISPHVRVIKDHGTLPGVAALSDVARYVKSYEQLLPGIIIPNFSAGALHVRQTSSVSITVST